MTAGLSIATWSAMIKKQPVAMKAEEKSIKTIWATTSMIENYEESLGVAGSGITTVDGARNIMINGVPERLTFNGYVISEMPIDSAISAYFGGYSPHRSILCVDGSIALILSSAGEFGESMIWFNKDENKTRTRTQFEMGGDFFEPLHIVAAFQD